MRTNIVTAVEMTDWRADYKQFPPLVASTAKTTLRDVTADKAYSGKTNLQAVADAGGTPYVPFNNDARTPPIPAIHDPLAPAVPAAASAWARMYHLFAYQRDTFLAHYHQRSNVETTFSMIKRKFGDSLRSKSDVGQLNEVLCKVTCYNLAVLLIACIYEIGLEPPRFGAK